MQSFKFKLIFINHRGFDSTKRSFQELIGTSFERNYRINLGVNVFIKNIEIMNGEIATLCFWDISEKEIFKFFRKALYRGATGAIIAFNLSDSEGYENAHHQIQEIHNFLGNKIPYVLIGVKKGKIDISLDLKEIKSSTEDNGGIFVEILDDSDIIFMDILKKMTQKIINSKVVVH